MHLNIGIVAACVRQAADIAVLQLQSILPTHKPRASNTSTRAMEEPFGLRSENWRWSFCNLLFIIAWLNMASAFSLFPQPFFSEVFNQHATPLVLGTRNCPSVRWHCCVLRTACDLTFFQKTKNRDEEVFVVEFVAKRGIEIRTKAPNLPPTQTFYVADAFR